MNSSSKKTKKRSGGGFFTAVLPVAAFLLFSATLTNRLGAVGRGYFSSVYELFIPVLLIAFAGIPEAVRRLSADYIESGRLRDARLTYRIALKLSLFSGTAGTLIIFIIAYPYARLFTGKEILPSLFIIAVSAVFCCFSAVLNGFYSSFGSFSRSELFYAVDYSAKIGFAMLFIKLFRDYGMSQFGSAASNTGSAVVYGTTVGDLTAANGVIAVKTALGAVLGVAVGSIFTAVIIFLFNKTGGDGFTNRQLSLSPKASSSKSLLDGLISACVPLTAATAVFSVFHTVDVCVIQNRISSVLEGETEFNIISQMYSEAFSSAASASVLNLSDKAETAKYMWGVFSAANDFSKLFLLIACVVAVPLVSLITGANKNSDLDPQAFYCEAALRRTMLAVFPVGLTLAFTAQSVFSVVYGRGGFADAMQILKPMLLIYGLFAFIISYAVSGFLVLYALGKISFAVKLTAVSAAVKIILDFILTGIPKLNIYGGVIGTLVFFAAVAAGITVEIVSALNIRPDWQSVIFKPALCALTGAFSGYCADKLLKIIIPDFNSSGFLSGNTLCTVISVLFSLLVYTISLLFVKEFKKYHILALSKGEKIAKTLEKYGMLG